MALVNAGINSAYGRPAARLGSASPGVQDMAAPARDDAAWAEIVDVRNADLAQKLAQLRRLEIAMERLAKRRDPRAHLRLEGAVLLRAHGVGGIESDVGGARADETQRRLDGVPREIGNDADASVSPSASRSKSQGA